MAQFGWRLLEELKGAERLGNPIVLREMIQPDAGGEEPLRGLGFDHPSGPHSSVGRYMTRGGDLPTFGHLGFTGCSLWVDPVRQLSVALLTNRVFPSRQNVEGIKGFRPVFHDASWKTGRKPFIPSTFCREGKTLLVRRATDNCRTGSTHREQPVKPR